MIKLLKAWNRARVESRRQNRQIPTYKKWLQHNPVTPTGVLSGPLISVIMPVYNPALSYLEAAINSVLQQSAQNFELCIIDDASTDEAIKKYLTLICQSDSRIHIETRHENGHISRASNDALNMSSGEWVCFLDQDDLLDPHAIEWFNFTLSKRPSIKMAYSDEDKVNDEGQRFSPHFKTDINRELLLAQNYVCHLTFICKSIVNSVGGFRVGFEGAQDHDLFLRCIEQISDAEVVHIPRVLYHWRTHANSTAYSTDAKPYAREAAIRSVSEALERRGFHGAHVWAEKGHPLKVTYPAPNPPPKISIIIPTRNARQLVERLIQTLTTITTYKNIEIILVNNNSDDERSIEYFNALQSSGVARILNDHGDFNYSRLNNFAARNATGSYLLLLNNDIEVIEAGWLDNLISIACAPGVGCVGAKLLYPNRTIQHAGVVIGLGGTAGHIFSGLNEKDPGYFYRAQVAQDIAAVTGACLLVKKDIYWQVNGLDETNFGVTLNDVDFCLKVRSAGYRNVYTPYALLIHHESATRGTDRSGEKHTRWRREVSAFKAKWGLIIQSDSLYNVNLSLDGDKCELASKTRPWKP